ncbi:hypothetical protein SAMN04488490_3187 [Marinobacter sp. LV10R510-11A]|uniref:hypothetical protein n=1 Tax=Marinobacter sp. LV10R510-11A TaxID=1415568 RepID=UPI000BB98812|nr:hypothetical protein [Marinobacter sp. LV10R510-11A]SOB77383.1 hypothetical protein SAMN04488490_3187 [Marinobacter sp. LV10R510-11A]
MTKKQSRMLWSEGQRVRSSLPSDLQIPKADMHILVETLDRKKKEQKDSPYNTRFDESCLAQLYS